MAASRLLASLPFHSFRIKSKLLSIVHKAMRSLSHGHVQICQSSGQHQPLWGVGHIPLGLTRGGRRHGPDLDRCGRSQCRLGLSLGRPALCPGGGAAEFGSQAQTEESRGNLPPLFHFSLYLLLQLPPIYSTSYCFCCKNDIIFPFSMSVLR